MQLLWLGGDVESLFCLVLALFANLFVLLFYVIRHEETPILWVKCHSCIGESLLLFSYFKGIKWIKCDVYLPMCKFIDNRVIEVKATRRKGRKEYDLNPTTYLPNLATGIVIDGIKAYIREWIATNEMCEFVSTYDANSLILKMPNWVNFVWEDHAC